MNRIALSCLAVMAIGQTSFAANPMDLSVKSKQPILAGQLRVALGGSAKDGGGSYNQVSTDFSGGKVITFPMTWAGIPVQGGMGMIAREDSTIDGSGNYVGQSRVKDSDRYLTLNVGASCDYDGSLDYQISSHDPSICNSSFPCTVEWSGAIADCDDPLNPWFTLFTVTDQSPHTDSAMLGDACLRVRSPSWDAQSPPFLCAP